jgi:hypothetical protein
MRTKPIYRFYLYVLICVLGCSGYTSVGRTNNLSQEEKKQGFRLLFDGKSMAQWRNYQSQTIKPQWQVIDETMVLTAKGGRDLVTKEEFGYFDLRLEYNAVEKCNSGIMFRVVEETEERNPWRLAPEYQIYDSYNVKVRGDRCAGALYGLIAAPKDIAKKPGQWNQVRILLEPAGRSKEHLRFWLNGRQTVDIIVEYAPDSQWSKLIRNEDFKDHFAEGFFKARRGPILLQDHGSRVAFRNIRIRELDGTVSERNPEPPKGRKHRLLVLTDIGGDPDDQQSMVRLLLYGNEFDLEGLVATSTRSRVNPEQIRERIEAYRKVRENLVKHAGDYPTADYLLSVVKSGTEQRNMTSVGEGKSTEGSQHIISVVDKRDDRPIWINIWGAPTDLAQALWDVSHSRSKEEVDAFVGRLRVYDIGGQDDCGGWICHNFPEIFWLRSVDMFQAISVRIARPFPPHVTGPNLETFTTEWVANNIRNHGPLGKLYPERKWKYEGDTPAFLYLLPIGLNDPEEMAQGGWGGRFNRVKTKNPGAFQKRNREAEKKFRDFSMYTEAADSWRYQSRTYNSTYAGLFRWRRAFQNDFAARMDWCMKSFEGANHPPVVKLDHQSDLKAKAGRTVKLSAEGTTDPDGDTLNYKWWQYAEPGSYRGTLDIRDANKADASFVVPDDAGGGENVHIICEVTDGGEPALTRYRRVIVEFSN